MTELATLPRDIQLLRQACNFLAECRDLDELKSLKDKAEGACGGITPGRRKELLPSE